MAERDTGFCLPPVLDKHDGTPRRVGFELEFSGISLAESARAIGKRLSGRIVSRNAPRSSFSPRGSAGSRSSWIGPISSCRRRGRGTRREAPRRSDRTAQPAASLFVPWRSSVRRSPWPSSECWTGSWTSFGRPGPWAPTIPSWRPTGSTSTWKSPGSTPRRCPPTCAPSACSSGGSSRRTTWTSPAA